MLHASGLLTLDLALAAFDEGLGLEGRNAVERAVSRADAGVCGLAVGGAPRRARPDVAALRAVRAHVPPAAHRPPRVSARRSIRSSCRAATGSSPKTSIARRARCRASSRRCWRTRRCRRGWRAAARPATRRRGRPNASRTPNGRATSCGRCSRGSAARWCALHRVPPLGTGPGTWPTRATTPTPTLRSKERFVQAALEQVRPARVLDVGCNTGHFSALAARAGASVVALDGDAAVAGRVWRRAEAERLDILPLVVNLARPSPATGWRNAECPSFLARAEGHADLVLMLAVLHHLLVTERVPARGCAEPVRRPDARCRGDRVCRPGGPDVPAAHARPRSPAHGPDRPDLRGCLRGALRDRHVGAGPGRNPRALPAAAAGLARAARPGHRAVARHAVVHRRLVRPASLPLHLGPLSDRRASLLERLCRRRPQRRAARLRVCRRGTTGAARPAMARRAGAMGLAGLAGRAGQRASEPLQHAA